MNGTRKTVRRPWNAGRAIVCLVGLSVLWGGWVGVAEEPPAPIREVLVELREVLGDLQHEISKLDAPLPERWELASKAIADVIEELLRESERPAAARERAAIAASMVRLDRMLHRWLESLKGRGTPRPAIVEGRRDDLRRWTDGYIAGATQGIPPLPARRVESILRGLLRGIAVQTRAEPTAVPPSLGSHVERLGDLLLRLDRILLRLRGAVGAPPGE